MRLLLPELADAAQRAVQAAYDMRAANSPAALQEARERALSASDDLVAAAGAALAVPRTAPLRPFVRRDDATRLAAKGRCHPVLGGTAPSQFS
ncbi:hypothetical protein [Streptomyces sp. NPDC088719]|uniref:hypothetical protein n=1 Tax=Streptomyces sp. NPDC088719 TaxID=3365872 RepID=UPI0038104D54